MKIDVTFPSLRNEDVVKRFSLQSNAMLEEQREERWRRIKYIKLRAGICHRYDVRETKRKVIEDKKIWKSRVLGTFAIVINVEAWICIQFSVQCR